VCLRVGWREMRRKSKLKHFSKQRFFSSVFLFDLFYSSSEFTLISESPFTMISCWVSSTKMESALSMILLDLTSLWAACSSSHVVLTQQRIRLRRRKNWTVKPRGACTTRRQQNAIKFPRPTYLSRGSFIFDISWMKYISIPSSSRPPNLNLPWQCHLLLNLEFSFHTPDLLLKRYSLTQKQATQELQRADLPLRLCCAHLAQGSLNPFSTALAYAANSSLTRVSTKLIHLGFFFR